jgi:putative Mg2+ transporter-C (MgtC) family protein
VDLYSPTMLVALKLLTAMLCGGAIGFERELSRKPAGLRTNVLICMGAALYMIVSRHIGGSAPSGDPGRLAAQVVTGIGFLGAGVILHHPTEGKVHGLTTAATIWVTASLGILCGLAAWRTVTVAILLTVVLLTTGGPFEKWCQKRFGSGGPSTPGDSG